MAYTLRYYKTLPQPGDRDIILEIYEKDGAGASVEIGPVIQALHLDIQGSQEDIDTPVVKTSLVMTFVDAPDHEEASSKKCGNWEEFYTPDSTYWKVVLKKRTASGSFTPIWGGYVTPDSFTEQLRYRGSVTIVARDNIGHMQDFPFDSKGNEDGMITVYDLVNTAWAKIESPMSLNWRGEEDEAMWLQCDGHDVTGAYLNVSAFKGMNWYEAMEKVLYSIGAVMRYVGDNTVQVSSLRYMPYQGRASMSSLAKIEPKFIAHANRELVPAVRRIEESVKYDISEVLLPLVEPSDFRGDVINGNVWPLINTESGNGWCNVMPSTALYFNPNGYAIEEYPYRPAFEMAQEQIYDSMFLLCNTEGLVEYSQVFAPMEVTLEVGLGGNIWLKDGKITNTASTVIRARYAIKAFYNGIDYFLDEDGSWTESYVEYTATREGESSLRIKSISHSIPLQAFDAPVVLHFYILELFDLNAEGKNIYVQVQSLKVIPNDNDSLLQTNNVNTIYNNDNNVIISRDPTIGPAYDFVYQGIIKNGMFIKSGDVYLPAKAWAWSGGTPQQMAVYNHLQLLCYHAKPNNVITGDIVNADLGNLRALYMWHGSEHLLQGGSLNFLNGRIEGAILREFARYDEMWGDVTGDSMPATEQESSTNVEEGGSSSGSSATYDNTTNVTIGGSGGGVSVTVDTFLSDTSTNPVQNKIIKQYIDTADNLLDEKIGNLAEHIDDLESSKAVIFDATSSTDPWELNVLQTSTTIEEMAEAINNGSPIYMRFGSGLVSVANAELYDNGDVSLYVHLVDPEDVISRTIHTYSDGEDWYWESFDNPMGGSANPDEEDITTNEEGNLQFKDRGNADGMGYVILRKDKTLTEQMQLTNTIYEVRYDFDLATGVVEMPAGSILKFNGGCISNGTLKGNNSQIDAEPVKIFDSITFTGSWMADAIYAEWWGAEGLYSRASYANEAYAPQALVIPSAVNNLPDSSVAINAALAFSSLTGGEVCLQGLVYRTTDTIVMDRYSTLKMQSETTIVPYLTGAGTLVVTHNVDDLTMTEETLDAPALTLARNQIIDTSSMAIAIKVNPVRTKLYGAGLLCLQKSIYTIGVCITSEGRHLMDMTYLTPSIDIVTVGDNRLTYAPDPRDIIGSGAPSASVGSGNTETIYYWDKTNKAYYSRSAGASSWSLVSSASDPKWNTSLRFDIGNKKTARLINPQVTIKDIFGARGIEVYMRVPSDYVDMPFFNHSTIKGSLSEKYSHYFSIFNEKGCSFDLHDWKDVVVQHSPINMYESSTFYAASGSGVEIGMIWDLKWLGSKSEVDFFLGKNTRKNTFMTSDGGVVVDLGVDNVFGEKKATAVVGGGAIPRIEMTASSAELAPNTFYVWNMADSLDLTLADGDAAVMNKYLFQFRNPVDSVTMLTLPDYITWSEDTELDENKMPVMEATAFYRIEIIEGFASLKKWKLAYIAFADAEVERVLMANGVGDGLGITKADAKKVSSLKKWFNGNTVIGSFEELRFFTSVAEIDYQAFMGCSELAKIDLCNVTDIGAESFKGCAKLAQDLEIPLCKSIDNAAFSGCTAITGLNAPLATSIGGSNFYLCAALKYANLQSAQNIDYRAFMGCTALEEVVTGSALTVIGAEAFRDCSIMTGYINVENVTSLGNAAFTNCSALNQDMHLKSLAGAVVGGFRGSGIRSLAFPLATSASAYQHFMNCKNLKYVLYGDSVTSIGTAQVFAGCTALEAIIILNATPPTLYGTSTLARPTNCPIYVPDSSVETYKGATNFTGNASYIKGISDLQSENPTIYAEIQQYL